MTTTALPLAVRFFHWGATGLINRFRFTQAGDDMDILSSKNNGVLTIEFNRPDKKNAITAAMYQLMADALKDAESDASVRAIVIIGKPEIFTAGNDLEDFMKN